MYCGCCKGALNPLGKRVQRGGQWRVELGSVEEQGRQFGAMRGLGAFFLVHLG